MERRENKNSSLYRGHKLFLNENRFEVMRVDCGIASISPFRIDVPLSSESVWFGAKTTRAEPDDKVELGEVLRPLYLPPGQYLGSREILKVFIILSQIRYSLVVILELNSVSEVQYKGMMTDR